MERAGIPVPGLQARDGLATINGSNLLTAMSAIHLYDIDRWLKQAEIACAMTLEALFANMKPYDVRLHELRGFAGAIRSAQAIMKCIEGSDLAHREDQDEGPGRLLDALVAAGDRRGARRGRLRARAGRDRAERRRRQPDLPARGAPHADRRELPGHARLAADGHGRRGRDDGVRALRAAPEPANEPGALPSACPPS